MESFKGALAASLRFRLSVWLSCAIALIAAGAGAFSFLSALDEAHSLQDNQLRQTAFLISRLDAVPASPLARERVGDVDFAQRMVVRYLRNANGEPVPRALRPPELSDSLIDGLQTVMVGRETWRVYVRTNAKGVRVAVAQQTTVRDAVALYGAWRTLMPILLLVPILILLVTMLLRHMFQPLKQLSQELGRRAEHDLGELNVRGLPSEVWPFVSEINQLLARVARALSVQRRFIADAAHEMRSPMTAMSLQAERLAAADMPQEARSRLLALVAGLHRARELLDQMLTLARTQEQAGALCAGVSLQQVIRDVLEDLMPMAEAKAVDVGVIGDTDADVEGSLAETKILVKNLVDNAIRYAPQGGQVDIAVLCTGGSIILQVDDTGPGIPADERERVFDPFYRVLGNGEMGSGLGLSIARTIARRMGAHIELQARGAALPGLRARIIFASGRASGPST
jgi:two-component system OmpR family sensor kinase